MLNSWFRFLESRPRRVASALRPDSQSAHSWATKPGTNVTMQTPPLSASRASTSSGTLRGLSQSARAEEWLKITGAAATSSASRIVTPNDFDSLELLSRTLLAFTDRYNQTARPFNWTFTAADLRDLMTRISQHQQQDQPHQAMPEAAGQPRRTYGVDHLSRPRRCGSAPPPTWSRSD
jgi:hypothetical protein